MSALRNREYRRAGKGTAVLFIHGILEGPDQFQDLCNLLPSCYAVTCLLLPGHGGSAAEFAGSSMKLWQESVCRELQHLQKQYTRILLVGHSLGCLLAINAALRYPQGVRGLFLMAPPLRMQMTLSGACNGLRTALHWVDENDPVSCAARDACSIRLPPLWGYISWLPRYLELFSQGARSRAEVTRLRLPVWAVFSERDEFVALHSAAYFQGIPNAKTIFLPKSGHFYYQPEEWARLLKCFSQFCRRTLEMCPG